MFDEHHPLFAAYEGAVRHLHTSDDERMAAAAQFHQIAGDLSTHEVAQLLALLNAHHGIFRHPIARALLVRDDEAAVIKLAEWALAGKPQMLTTPILIQLYRFMPDYQDRLYDWMFRHNYNGFGIEYALLDRPTEKTRARFEEMLALGSAFQAVEAVGRWHDHDLLWSIVERFPPQQPPTLDDRIDMLAALQLALDGDERAVHYLEQAANQLTYRAANACQYLAYLGWPGAIDPIKSLLSQATESHIIGTALSAAGDLRTPLLLPSIFRFAEMEPEDLWFDDMNMAMCDFALQRLSLCVGQFGDTFTGPEFMVRSDAMVYSPEYRAHALMHSREIAPKLDPTLRYHDGYPLTLFHLVDDLRSRDGLPREQAYHHLRAITSEDHGYYQYEDLIGNFRAIQAWRERVQEITWFQPGDWANAGKRLAVS